MVSLDCGSGELEGGAGGETLITQMLKTISARSWDRALVSTDRVMSQAGDKIGNCLTVASSLT